MSSSDAYPSDDSLTQNQSRGNLKPAEILSRARQQVDHLAPHVDLTTALLARYPWGYGPNAVRRSSVSLLATARASLDREITDTEASAIMRVTRAKVSAEGQAQWLSVVVAGAFWWRGIKTFRFPFYTPKVPPLGGGPLAQTMRMIAYSTVTMFVMSPVESVIGTLAASSSAGPDKQALEGLMKEVMNGRRHRGGMHGQQGMGAMGQQSLPGQQQQQQDQQSTYATRWPSDDSQYNQQQASTSETARWPSDASTQYTPEPTQPGYQPSKSAPTYESSDRWSSSPVLDDASPLALEESSAPQQPSTTSWARLRQQARVDSQQRQQQQQQGQQQGSWQQVRSSGGDQSGWASNADDGAARAQSRDSYTFSAADAERETAKSQAQKEFDAMLEKERRGEGDGAQGGWRK